MRIVYLATADARGHLMRAQLLVRALRDEGTHVEVLTTSDAGRDFFQAFGIDARVLSRHYAVQFDKQQNMLRRETDRNVAHYVFMPSRMLRDMMRLVPVFRHADLFINDSFHPALLVMGALPGWRRKVVHVYGRSLKDALVANFEGRLPRLLARAFGGIIGWQISAALCCVEHDFASDIEEDARARRYRLPTPVPVAGEQQQENITCAAIYLNPHFRDIALADALCAGLHDAGLGMHRVGEGYAMHEGWVGVDPDWVTRAAHAPLIVSAPGMAALSIALVYQRPILLVLTDQPEQMANATRAESLNIMHRAVIWRGDATMFRQQVGQAAIDLMCHARIGSSTHAGRTRAHARIEAWTRRILALCAPEQVAATHATHEVHMP
jgi:hypothetical protein